MKDITVVITSHDEGRILHRTLVSVFRSIEFASEKGLKIEVILHFDNPSKRVLEYIKGSKYKPLLRIYENNFKDLGLSRNFASSEANGKYISFVDGDDLFCENWLFEAFEFSENLENESILHPEYYISFDSKNLIWKRISSTDKNFRYGALMYFNPWDSTIFLKKTILKKCKFRKLPEETGFGYEDYAYFCDTLAMNIQHLVVPMTAVFIRAKKTGSLLLSRASIYSVLPFTNLFNKEVLRNLIKEKSGAEFLLKGDSSKKSLKHKLLEPFPRFHLFLYRIKLKIFEVLNKIKKGFVSSPEEIPSWLYNEWKNINNIVEAQVFPPVGSIFPYSIYSEKYDDTFAAEYLKKESKINENVILVSFIKIGGAEKVLFNFLRALQNIFKNQRITVIATSQSDSPCRNMLQDSVDFIDIGNLHSYFDDAKKENLLLKLLVQKSPKRIFNLSSELGFIVFNKYGKALRAKSQLYAFMFCEFYDKFGRIGGYGTSYLDYCIDNLEKVFTDNQRYIKFLCNMYGFDETKFVPLYQPVDYINIQNKEYSVTGVLKLLWAGRLDYQKHPEIAYEIANSCKNLPIKIDLYGQKVLDSYFHPKKLKKIEYKGTFSNGLKEVVDGYDGFLYTSESDGMPNIILEAVGMGLPIIAPEEGGLVDLLEHKRNALLVDKFDNVNGYKQNIQYVLDHRKEFNEYAVIAQREMLAKHDWKIFEKTIKENLT